MHPVLFEIFGYQVRTYSVAMALGFVVGLILIRRRAPLERVDVDVALNAAVSTIFGTIIGGRALFVITTWGDNFAGKPWYEALKIWQGGLVFYGGFFGSIISVVAYLKYRRQAFGPVMDLISPYVGLGLAIHRSLGCFMNGCCFGAPTDLPWGVHFPPDAPATRLYGVGQAVHPTEIYLALNGLFIFLILRWYRNRKVRQGEVFALLLALYAVGRFIVEFYRGDPVRGFVAQNQLFGLAVFVVGLVLFLFFTWKRLRAGQVAALMFVVAAAVMGFMGIYSDTSDVEQITPFSTSQFLGFYVFATGLAMFLRARYFGDPRPPDYGRPPLDAAPATANQLG